MRYYLKTNEDDSGILEVKMFGKAAKNSRQGIAYSVWKCLSEILKGQNKCVWVSSRTGLAEEVVTEGEVWVVQSTMSAKLLFVACVEFEGLRHIWGKTASWRKNANPIQNEEKTNNLA